MDNSQCDLGEAINKFAGVLPTPLTSIEKFHLFDGDEIHPNLIFGRLLFEESVNQDLALQAWKIATTRQPLISATIKRIRGKLSWTFPTELQPELAAHKTFCFQRLESSPRPWMLPKPVDTNENPGPFLMIRVWTETSARESQAVSPGNERAEIWFWAHHALCDGAAAIVFINDWLQIYRNLVAGVDALHRVSKVDYSLTPRRNDLGFFSWDVVKHLPQQIVGLYGAAKFIFRKTATCELPAGHSENRDKETPTPTIVSQWLSEESVAGLLANADRLGVSLNSILVSELFRTLHKWRVRQGITKKEWLRIILPMNIREFEHRDLPVANRSSIVQIDRRDFESVDTDQLIRSVDREVNVIRRWRLDRMFLVFVRAMSLFESSLRKVAQNRKTRGIAIFTNLGRPIRRVRSTRESNAESLNNLVEFDFVGPTRHGTPFNFAVGRFRGRIRLSLHFNSNSIPATEAAELLRQYCQELDSQTAI